MNHINISNQFTQTSRATEKEEARQRDWADLQTRRVTLTELNQRNRAIPKVRVQRSQILSWGF
jgi:hypothetical protein